MGEGAATTTARGGWAAGDAGGGPPGGGSGPDTGGAGGGEGGLGETRYSCGGIGCFLAIGLVVFLAVVGAVSLVRWIWELW